MDMPPNLFIHSLLDGHLDYIMAILNRVAINICIQIFVRTYDDFSWNERPLSGGLEYLVDICLRF